MEGNDQGGDSHVNNANDDWKSQHEPDLRRRVLSIIVQKLKKYFPTHSQIQLSQAAAQTEVKIYAMAKTKDEYMQKMLGKIKTIENKLRDIQSGSPVNGTSTRDPSAAQVLNQEQSLPSSSVYTQNPTSQKWLQQNIQRNVNTPGSSGSPTGSVTQNVSNQIQMQGRQELLSQQQQNSNNMFRHQVNQQLPKENARHENFPPPYTQQQTLPPQHQKSLLKQPVLQQLPRHTSLSTLQQSVPQSSSGQHTSILQKSQFLPRPQVPPQQIHSTHQQQMPMLSQEQEQQEQEKSIGRFTPSPGKQQNQLTSPQNNGGQQGGFMVSSPQTNNIASFQAKAQQNTNLQVTHQQRLCNNASALPSRQQQNVPRSSLLGTQGQEVGHSQPMMLQQPQPQHPVQQQFQNRSTLHNDTQRFQAAGSSRHTQNIAEQQNQRYHLHRAPQAHSSASQDSTPETVNASGGNWQEETYHKIQSLKEMYFPALMTMLQKITEKLREIDSLPQQRVPDDTIDKLRQVRSTVEQVIVFLNVPRSRVSEKHRDSFSIYEEQVSRLTKSRTVPQRPMQQQQQQQRKFPPSQMQQTALHSQSHQLHVSKSPDNDQMNSQWMPSNQNRASSSVSGLTKPQIAIPYSVQTRPKMEPKDENLISGSSGNVAEIKPQVVSSNISSVQSSLFHEQQQQLKQFHHRQMQQQLPPMPSQQFQMPSSHQTNEMSDARKRQRIDTNGGSLQQRHSSSQLQPPKRMASSVQMYNSPSAASSPQIQHHSSPQLVDQQILLAAVNKNGISSQSGGLPFVAPSPVTSVAPSPTPGDPEKLVSVESPILNPYQGFSTAIHSAVDMHGTDEQPPFCIPNTPVTERPIDRLIKAFQSSTPKSLAESVREISSVINLADRIAGSFHSSVGSRAGLGEDLSANFCLQERNLMTHPVNRLKRSISSLPPDIVSQTDGHEQFNSLESEVDSTASSGSKINKIESCCALLQEINEINGRLVETEVNICNEDVYPSGVTSGTVVTCSYNPVALSATFKAHYQSGHIIEPLNVLVPENYPHSSPILLEDFPFDGSIHKCEDLSARTRMTFRVSLRKLSEPMSLKDIVQTWNDCARATMEEYAEQRGGGTFSSKYGTWETILGAS